MAGTEDIPFVKGFNDSSYYHGCEACPKSCWVEDYTNLTEVPLLHCVKYNISHED